LSKSSNVFWVALLLFFVGDDAALQRHHRGIGLAQGLAPGMVLQAPRDLLGDGRIDLRQILVHTPCAFLLVFRERLGAHVADAGQHQANGCNND
jgi:hypothetical protein